MKTLLFSLILGALTALSHAQKPTSFYSSTAGKSVAVLSSSALEKEPEIDHFIHLCPGYGGYELVHESGDSRSWINVKYGSKKSELMNPTFNAAKGHFPFKANDVVEWRGILKGENFAPYAIIYRISAHNPDTQKNFTRLVVIALNKGNSRVLGSTSGETADADAKKLADTVKPG